jgi:MYXO-CTERM domain-containing protein
MWALLFLATTASAESLIDGEQIRVYYNDQGTWNGDSSGFQINNGAWQDATFPGSPWQQISFEWDQDGSSHSYGGNRDSSSWAWTMDEVLDLSSGDFNEIIHRWTMGNLQVSKSESWADGDSIMLVHFMVTNTASSTATDLRIMHGVDPDQDAGSYGTYSTLNDVVSDGTFLSMVGPSSGLTLGYGLCNISEDELGITGWNTDADAAFADPDGASEDNTGHWRHTEASIAAGQTIVASFVVSVGATSTDALNTYVDNYGPLCGLCDADGDGFLNSTPACGGSDCDDEDADVYPGALEICDAVDNDCDGSVDEAGAVGELTIYEDADGDGFGGSSTTSCELSSGYVMTSGDCDDINFAIYPGADELCDGQDNDCDGEVDEVGAIDALLWHTDADADGFGDPTSPVYTCTMEDGTVSDNSDCNDSDSSVHPGADEICNGWDDDCDLLIDEDSIDAPTWYADSDEDGFGDPESTSTACTAPDGFIADALDCDDTLSTINPAATERCNLLDDDCDGAIDEPGSDGESIWFIDYDSDGFGSAAYTTEACDRPDGFSDNADDCNDAAGDIHPGAVEVCDATDNDCDGTVDEPDAEDAMAWYPDLDADGFGDPDGETTLACTVPDGSTADRTDCDDSRPGVNPDADEVCDDIDNNCNGAIDEDDAIDALTWYIDYDSDGHGSTAYSTTACDEPEGYTSLDDDCDDTLASIHPGALEYCDGVDNDCDGETDEGDAEDSVEWFADSDHDGYADAGTSTWACNEPTDHILDEEAMGWDCDDNDAAVHPGATEVWYDDLDQDCDGESDWDADADGFELIEEAPDTGDLGEMSDCDDEDPDVFPGAPESWYDGVDGDCDGESDFDADGDGYESASFDGDDCDDADPETYPGAPDEPGDGIITDCDESDEFDADGDGYTSEDAGGDDCDDANGSIHPGAEDIPDDGIDQDCDGEDATTVDTGEPTDTADPDGPDEDTAEPEDTASSSDDTGESSSGEEEEESTDTGADGVGLPLGEKDGCGCATTSGGASGFLPLLLVGLVRRRRMSTPLS